MTLCYPVSFCHYDNELWNILMLCGSNNNKFLTVVFLLPDKKCTWFYYVCIYIWSNNRPIYFKYNWSGIVNTRVNQMFFACHIMLVMEGAEQCMSHFLFKLYRFTFPESYQNVYRILVSHDISPQTQKMLCDKITFKWRKHISSFYTILQNWGFISVLSHYCVINHFCKQFMNKVLVFTPEYIQTNF